MSGASHWHQPFPPEVDDSWRLQAACIGFDHLFFPEQGQTSRRAKQLCAECPVREPCLDYAITSGSLFGIWGGLGEKERATFRRRQRREAS